MPVRVIRQHLKYKFEWVEFKVVMRTFSLIKVHLFLHWNVLFVTYQ